MCSTQPKSTTKYKEIRKRRRIIQGVFSRENEKKLREVALGRL
jgi:hypothetical protein